MKDDKQSIMDLFAMWQQGTRAGDYQRLLNLMSDDVVFLIPE